MYSPKIAEDLIPKLYKRAKQENRAMTKLVNEIIRGNMEEYEEEKLSKTVSVCGSCLVPLEVDIGQTEAFCEKCQTTVFVHCKQVA